MAFNRDLIVREVRAWQDNITGLDNIPFNFNHKYKNEKDIYERLTVYVKQWVEGVFGYYTNEAGELVQIPDQKPEGADADLLPEKNEFCKNWLQTAGQNMTPLSNDWFKVALKGAKKGNNPLPRIKSEALKDQDIQAVYNDARSDVVTTFFPAYRALRASFEKRWWFEWIFNHKQYTAERDALKVMTNLITSMTRYTEEQLTTEYNRHLASITPQEVSALKLDETVRQRETQEDLLQNAPLIDRAVEVDGVLIEERQDELFENAERLDLGFHPEEDAGKNVAQDEVKEEPVQDDVKEEPIPEEKEQAKKEVEEKSAVDKLVSLDTKKKNEAIWGTLVDNVQNSELNELAIYNTISKGIYNPLYNEAMAFCNKYDTFKGTLKDDPTQLKEIVQQTTVEATKKMFETAFKGVSATSTTGGVEQSVLGIRSLKDRIVSAQKIADVMLTKRTPVGFKKDELGEYGKGYHLLENTDKVYQFIKKNYADKYSDKEISRAINLAKNELLLLHRGEKDVSNVYEIGYRPNPQKLTEEGKELNAVLHLVNKNKNTGTRVIDDPALLAVISTNVRRWKEMSKNVMFKQSTFESSWIETDKKLDETYPGYDVESSKKLVNEKLEQKKAQKLMQQQLKQDLKESKGKVVPPVEKKPTEINPIKVEK